MNNDFIYGLNQFNQPPLEQPPVHTALPVNLNDPAVVEFVRTHVEAARKEEKDKLYARIQELSDSNRTLTQSMQTLNEEMGTIRQQREQERRSELTPDERVQQQIADLEARLTTAQTELTTAQADLRASLDAQILAEEQYQLQLYLEQKLRELTEKGVGYTAHMITGTDRASLDASINAAVADYETQRAFFYEQFLAQNPQAAAPAPAPEPSNAVRVFATPPSAPQPYVITPTAPAPTPSGMSSEVTFDQIHTLTQPDAIRSGDYAQRRTEILARLRENRPEGTTLPLRPFPSAHPQQPATPASVPRTPAIVHQHQPNGVIRPVAAPMPAMQPPQHAHSQFAPQATPPAATAPQQADAHRQAAAEAAHRALTSPAAALNMASRSAGQPAQNHGAFAMPVFNGQAAQPAQLLAPGHPMIR